MTATPAPTTVACETGRHHRCRGQAISLVAPAGTPCSCACHADRGSAPS